VVWFLDSHEFGILLLFGGQEELLELQIAKRPYPLDCLFIAHLPIFRQCIGMRKSPFFRYVESLIDESEQQDA
jgi:hypothetical protein